MTANHTLYSCPDGTWSSAASSLLVWSAEISRRLTFVTAKSLLIVIHCHIMNAIVSTPSSQNKSTLRLRDRKAGNARILTLLSAGISNEPKMDNPDNNERWLPAHHLGLPLEVY